MNKVHDETKRAKQDKLNTGVKKTSIYKIFSSKIMVLAILIATAIFISTSSFVLINIKKSPNDDSGISVNTSTDLERSDEPDTPQQIDEKIANIQDDIKRNVGDTRKNYENIGLLYLEKKDYPMAIENLERALQNGGIQDEKAVYSALGIAYYSEGRKDDAINAYNKLITLYSSEAMSPFDELTVENYKTTIVRIQRGEEL